jgi:hypothetical protein
MKSRRSSYFSFGVLDQMEVRLLLNEDRDINDDLFHEPPVPGPTNLPKLTFDEIHLGLLHTDIKNSVMGLALIV